MNEETPQRIIQTWKDNKIPPHLKDYFNEWRKVCIREEYDHVLYTDKDLRDRVIKYTPQFINAYDTFTNKIERVDFARYVILYAEGGVYADLDTIPLKSIRKFIEEEKIVLGCEPIEHAKNIYSRNTVLCNAFMISPPKKELWLELCNFIIKNYTPHGKPVYNTGPMALTLLYENRPELFKNVIITNTCIFFPITDNEYSNKTQIHPVSDKEFKHVSKECDIEAAYVAHMWSHEWVGGFDEQFKNLDYWIIALASILVIVLLFPPQCKNSMGFRKSRSDL